MEYYKAKVHYFDLKKYVKCFQLIAIFLFFPFLPATVLLYDSWNEQQLIRLFSSWRPDDLGTVVA